MLEGYAYWPLHIDRDRLSRHGYRLLNAGGLSQRQTWASRFSSALALRLRPTVEPSLIHAAVDFSRPWRTDEPDAIRPNANMYTKGSERRH